MKAKLTNMAATLKLLSKTRYRKRRISEPEVEGNAVDSGIPTPPVSSPESDECVEIKKRKPNTLETNPDYITLCSTLNLLYGQREKVRQDIVELRKYKQELKQDHRKLLLVLTGKQLLPVRNQIVKCPLIDFTKYDMIYQEEQSILCDTLSHVNEQVYQVSRMFD